MVVHGSGFSTDAPPVVRLGGHPALVAFVSPTRMVVLVPSEVEGEGVTLEIEDDGSEVTRVEVGVPWATGTTWSNVRSVVENWWRQYWQVWLSRA